MKKIIILLFILFLFSFIEINIVLAEEEFLIGQETGFLPELQMQGRLEASGTYFELTNSSYLNITLDSSELIKIVLESLPEMITMHIEAVSDATSTVITLSGFTADTTYHKYEDDYHNHVAFTTDASGRYSYVQDLSKPHFIFIQPRASTKFIKDDATGGDCTLIGTWNSSTKTCTLTMNLTESIQIDSNGITLDGNGHMITGTSTGYGVYLSGKTGVTIKNLNIKTFTNGIYLRYSNNNILTSNTASSNRDFGIYLYSSNSNTLTSNIANANSYGIPLASSNNNILTGNIANANSYGIYIQVSNNNILTSNTASSNIYYGILLSGSSNTLTGNIANANSYGIYIQVSNNNILTSNIAQENNYDVDIIVSSDAQCNNVIANTTGSGNRPIKYFNSSVTLGDETLSELILCNADGSSINNITIDGSVTKQNNMLLVLRTDNSNFTNIKSSNNYIGIYFYQSNFNNITNNTANNNGYAGFGLFSFSNFNSLISNTANNNSDSGFFLDYSSNNSLISNTANFNAKIGSGFGGFRLDRSSNNSLISNTANNNSNKGFILRVSSNNNLTSNTANNNFDGFYLSQSSNNTLTGNTANSNTRYGIYLYLSSSNTLTSNIANANSYGIIIESSSNNKIYNNNFINNPMQAYVSGGGNVFNLSAPIGGNYWSNYDTPSEGCNDLNNDNFCDAPYVFTGGQDNLPWTMQSGWEVPADSTPPTTTDDTPLTWQKTDFTVTLTCTDNAGGSGCKETKYRVNSGSWQTSTSIPISTEGDYLIEYYSIDNADNQENVKSTHAKLDKTLPIISINTPMPYSLYIVGMALDFSASDLLSGLKSVSGILTNTAGEYQEVNISFVPSPGVYTLVVSATDNAGNIAVSGPIFFVVYDPTGGFATGGGWFYPDSESTLPGGKAIFGFVAKYKNANSTGNLEFQYKDANINFKSTSIDWLVISGVSAQFQGRGTINNEGLYTFRVLAKDNGEPGVGTDHFDIKIWQGTDTDAAPIHKAKNILSGGNVVIHKK